jgi:GNAT superfamily N-acetyltransferase
MEFRIAGRKDLPRILELYRQLNPDDVPISAEKANKVWDKVEGGDSFLYFIALDEARIVASCNIAIVPNLTRGGRPYAIIENVITDGEYRRRGLGEKVLRMAIHYARAVDCYKVSLMSSNKRVEAHAFYEAIGFDGDSKKGFEIRF